MAHIPDECDARPTFYEFFAGGGMARAGLGDNWQCVFANDFSEMKAKAYAENWGSDHLVCGDIGELDAADLPGRADLAWASFPCQDLSLAGSYRGLGDATSVAMTRSGTFWLFWNLMRSLRAKRLGPKLIVLENVPGALTSNNGGDFRALCDALAEASYRFGAVLMDAKDFVPQSRQRLFFVAVAPDITIPDSLFSNEPTNKWHPQNLRFAQSTLVKRTMDLWVWWTMPAPSRRNVAFVDLIEEQPTGCRWHSQAETARLLDMMTPLNLEKIEMARSAGRKIVGGVYKRTRPDADGVKHQRAEVRFDDLAGCLRTPAGGSSRQTIVVVEGSRVRSRLLSPREAARLMGLDDSYRLPDRYNDAYHVAGDGVCVPVVRYLADNILENILGANETNSRQRVA